jgi:hypothetical protein
LFDSFSVANAKPQCVSSHKNLTMNKKHEQIELKEKIVKGLDIVYERLLEFKKQKKSDLVIMKGNKIIRIKP